jgi:chorismate synthase
MFNTLGNLLSLTTFGESHGVAYGGIINNFPAGLTVDFDKIQYELNRRKPGQSAIVTQRKESDTVKFLSGILKEKQQELRLASSSKTKIRNQKIMIILQNLIVRATQILLMIRNLD